MHNASSSSAVLLVAALALGACQQFGNLSGLGTVAGRETGTAGASAGATATAQRMDADMAQVTNALSALRAQPIETLSVERARGQPTPADAVRRVLQERGQPAAPRPVPQVRDISVPTPAGPIPARVYGPARGSAPAAPLIVYWHGGGWVMADLDTYDASARALQAETGAVVLSLHYRQAPEHKFPAAHEDAVAAYRWAVGNARSLGADGRRRAPTGAASPWPGRAPAATSPSTPPSRRATRACRRRGTWR